MITTVIFDLDGVLIDSREVHFIALNRALEKVSSLSISKEEHLSRYDGLPTKKKLELLTKEKNLNPLLYDRVWSQKQKETYDVFDNLKPDPNLVDIFSSLKEKGYSIGVCSNSIRTTVKIILLRLGLMEYVDVFLSNEDVSKPKPYPEMFWQCMQKLNTTAPETLIVEDSHIGRTAVFNSGANLLAIENSVFLNKQMIVKEINKLDNTGNFIVPWKDSKLNILIPMAGAGSRFVAEGYIFPKPLIEVHQKPMIQVVVENLNIEARFIFLVQKEHYEKYNLKYVLQLISPGCDIIQVDGLTEGAACTTLLAKELINDENPLLIANSDQYIEWNSNECMYAFTADGIDGGLLTFESTHPKWSFAKLDDTGFVSEVAEKTPISNIATCGIYYWKKGSDYVKYAEQMINKNLRFNKEFYICPVYNEAIGDGKKIRIKQVKSMWGLGTPDDLDLFLRRP